MHQHFKVIFLIKNFFYVWIVTCNSSFTKKCQDFIFKTNFSKMASNFNQFNIEFIKGESNSLSDFLSGDFFKVKQVKMSPTRKLEADYAKPPQSLFTTIIYNFRKSSRTSFPSTSAEIYGPSYFCSSSSTYSSFAIISTSAPSITIDFFLSN